MAGRLAIDLGNAYTTAAYWQQETGQAATLYIPGATRPLADGGTAIAAKVFAAPSVIGYQGAGRIIGQQALEGVSGLAGEVFADLQFAVITGKRVYSAVHGRRLSGQDMAGEYAAAFISRAGQALGLNKESVLTFTMPLAACTADAVWQRCRRWLEETIRQAGFSRLELAEEPWAAAWGAGMPVKPGQVYIFIKQDAGMLEIALVQAANRDLAKAELRHTRIISYVRDWLTNEAGEAGAQEVLARSVRQVLREGDGLGYAADSFAGLVITGSNVTADTLAGIAELFPGIPVYRERCLSAAACGAVMLSAGMAGCGCLRHGYGLQVWTEDGYRYRELLSAGLVYPSEQAVAEFSLRASYDGQQDFALFIYRQSGVCVNEDAPLLLPISRPAAKGQAVIGIRVKLDGAGQLVVTAWELSNGIILADDIIAAQLV